MIKAVVTPALTYKSNTYKQIFRNWKMELSRLEAEFGKKTDET